MIILFLGSFPQSDSSVSVSLGSKRGSDEDSDDYASRQKNRAAKAFKTQRKKMIDEKKAEKKTLDNLRAFWAGEKGGDIIRHFYGSCTTAPGGGFYGSCSIYFREDHLQWS